MNTLQLSGIGASVNNPKENDVIRTNLLLNLGDKTVISITPTAWSEEVPALAVRLAETLARGQRNVLLVNADSANQTFFETESEESAEEGLFTVLTSETGYEACLCQTDISGLTVLPAGPLPEYASELLSGVRFGELLKNLKKQFDYVFVLLPAMDKSLDGIAASAKTDGCIVIGFTNTSFSKIKDAAKMLQKSTTIIGSVLINNTSSKKPAFFRKK